MAEAARRAFADRARWMGDPAFVTVPVRGLLDPAYVAARAATIDDARATPSTAVGAGAPVFEEGGQTLHFSVVDARGGAVALTTTLNSYYGSGIVAAGTGILLNNEIDDFSIAAGVANQYGLVGGEANAPAPGKRPLSSMSPTIVEAREPGTRALLVLGSPGGPTIISSVIETIVNVIDHGMSLSEAVSAPRFHHQWIPDRIDHETGAFPADVADALRARGHALAIHKSDGRAGPMGNVAAIALDPVDGSWLGAADPRDEAAAGGY
jgi:gamma-glutamyltranspeptidase/glutathione hydrolase